MKWNDFCEITDMGLVIEQGIEWESGTDEEGAEEFVRDALTNRLGLSAEVLPAPPQPNVPSMGPVVVWGKIAAQIVRLVSEPIINLKIKAAGEAEEKPASKPAL